MDVSALFTTAAEHGVTLFLAVVALWMLNDTWKARHKDAERYAGAVREWGQTIVEVLSQNTEALTRLEERLKK